MGWLGEKSAAYLALKEDDETTTSNSSLARVSVEYPSREYPPAGMNGAGAAGERDESAKASTSLPSSSRRTGFWDRVSILQSYAVQVYCPSLFVFGCNGMVIPVIPPMAREVFQASDTMNGLVMSSLNLAGVVVDIPGAFLIARLGADLSRVFSGSMLFLSGILGATARNVYVLTLSRVVHGLGQVTWLTSRTYIFSLASAKAGENHRGFLISGLGGMQRISSVIMPILGSYVAARFGFRAVFLLVSTFGALVVPFALMAYARQAKSSANRAPLELELKLRRSPLKTSSNALSALDHEEAEALVPNATQGRGPKTQSSSLIQTMAASVRVVREIMRMNWRELLTVGSPCLVLNMLRQARDFLFALAAMNAGFNQGEIGLLVSSMYTMDFLSFPLSGILMDRFGRKYALTSSLLCLSLGCVLLSVTSGYKALIFLVAFVAGSGSGIGAGIAMCMGADLSNVALLKHKRRRLRDEGGSCEGPLSDKFVMTVFLGIFRATQDLGQFFGPSLVGTLSQVVSLRFSGLLCGGAGVLAAGFTVLCVEETRDLARKLLDQGGSR